jgi:hypothetical protein
MRPWIDVLFHNSAAHVDFLKYIDEVRNKLLELEHNFLVENKLDEARSAAFELRAYETIAKVFKRETQEHQKQVELEVGNARTRY